MPNKYCNLDGSKKISEDYPNINIGFEKVQEDTDSLQSKVSDNEADIESKLQTHKDSASAHNADNLDFTAGTSGIVAVKVGAAIKEIKARVEQIITTPVSGAAATQEVVDARQSAVKGTTFASVDARLEAIETDASAAQYATPVTATVSSIGLPTTAMKGQLNATLQGNTRNNLIKSSNMNTDTNADGVVDDFTSSNSISATLSLNDNAQKISISNCAVNNNTAYVRQGTIGDSNKILCSPGDVLSLKVDCKFTKTAGAPLVKVWLYFRDAAGASVGSDGVDIIASTNGYTSVKVENKIAPANTVYASINFILYTSASASVTPETADVWFKNALVEKAASVGSYITSGVKSSLKDGGRVSAKDGTNYITNGNFANGTTGWGSYGAVNSVAANTLSNVGNGAYQYPDAHQTTSIALALSKQIYVKCKARVTNESAASIIISAQSSGGGANLTFVGVPSQSSPVANRWYTLYGILTVPAGFTAGSLVIKLLHSYADAATANGKVLEIQEVMSIDMGVNTSNGLFNLTVAQMDAKFPNWFEGSQNLSQAYIPVSTNGLTSVGSLKDEINVANGVKIQRNNSKILQSSDITGLTTTNVNNDIVVLSYTNISDMKDSGVSDTVGTKMATNRSLPRNSAVYDSVDTVWRHYFGVGGWYIIVPKGYYANLAAAQTDLAGTIVIYQLAAPITSTIEGMGQLTAEPYGTIVLEPVVKFEAKPLAGVITIPAGWANILTVESVRKITMNADDTVTYESVTPSSNTTTTVTLPAGYDDIKFYEVVCQYDWNLTTLPDIIYSYPTNARGEIDSAVNALKQTAKDLDELNDFVIAQLIALNSASVTSRSVQLTLGAISATTTQIAFIARVNGYLNKCQIATKNAIAANDTDYWTISLVDKGSDGTPANTIASKTTKVTGGAAFAAYDMWDIGALDATHKVMAAGDVVILTLTKSGNAAAFAEALCMLEFVPIY